ncbi:MAG: hypothetical protein AAF367_00420 [Pseudomonadota bacterium]
MTTLPRLITEDPRYARVHDERERHAAEARSGQARYRGLTRIFIIGSTAAAIAGGLVLYGTEATVDESNPALVNWIADGPGRTGLIILQSIGLAAAAGSGYLLGKRDPAKRWIAARLRAEDGRLLLARRALEIGHEKGAETFSQAGSSFVSFMEGQLDHLDKSAQSRDRASLRAIIFGAVLAALAALASVMTGLDSRTLVVILAIFGVGVPALTAAAEKWGEASADGERADLHKTTWSALSALRDDLPGFNAAIEARDLSAAEDFADRVFAVLRRDHEGFAAIEGEAGSTNAAGS